MLPLRWRLLYLITFVPLGCILFAELLLWALYVRLILNPLRWASKRRSKSYCRGKGRPLFLFLPYMTETNASARYRVYNYLRYITEEDLEIHLSPPSSEAVFNRFFRPWRRKGHYIYFILVFLQRARAIWMAANYDAVLVQRELISEFFYDPPLFIFVLWLINPRIVYDADDAVWMLPPHSVRGKSKALNYLARKRFYWNVRLSREIIVSNRYLAEEASRINGAVDIIPTPVDVGAFRGIRRQSSADSRITIGWTGGGGNVAYLRSIEKVLSEIAKLHPIRLKIISSMSLQLSEVEVDFVPWDRDSEYREICSFDIGIMCLPDNPYTRGKAGFKLLLYMAAGIPSVASAVGANNDIVEHGKTGFLAGNEGQWKDCLERLIRDPSLRTEMGARARAFVVQRYSYPVWAPVFRDILKNVVSC